MSPAGASALSYSMCSNASTKAEWKTALPLQRRRPSRLKIALLNFRQRNHLHEWHLPTLLRTATAQTRRPSNGAHGTHATTRRRPTSFHPQPSTQTRSSVSSEGLRDQKFSSFLFRTDSFPRRNRSLPQLGTLVDRFRTKRFSRKGVPVTTIFVCRSSTFGRPKRKNKDGAANIFICWFRTTESELQSQFVSRRERESRGCCTRTIYPLKTIPLPSLFFNA